MPDGEDITQPENNGGAVAARDPGVFFGQNPEKNQKSGKILKSAIILKIRKIIRKFQKKNRKNAHAKNFEIRKNTRKNPE